LIELEPIWMQSLVPAGGRQDFGALVEELLRQPPAADPPYLACNFISTLDGRATVGGSTGELGFPADGRALMRLRTFADAVMIGAGTMRVERYDRMLPVERLREYRAQIGLPEDPLTVIVTATLDLPWDAGLFTDGHGEVLLATTSTDSPPATATSVEVLRYCDRVDLRALRGALAERRGARSVVCEGGPTVLGGLVEAGLVDDLFLTFNPTLAGSRERALLNASLTAPIAAELAWLLEAEGELFSRWRLRGAAPTPPPRRSPTI
jgi:riboflavin biosynthesis pyrimidine reductase